jgi:hypothetical protein
VEVVEQEVWEVQEVNPQPLMYLMVAVVQELFLLLRVHQFNMRVEAEVVRLLLLYLVWLLWVVAQAQEMVAITQPLHQFILLVLML